MYNRTPVDALIWYEILMVMSENVNSLPQDIREDAQKLSSKLDALVGSGFTYNIGKDKNGDIYKQVIKHM